jgi:hypothetical protein
MAFFNTPTPFPSQVTQPVLPIQPMGYSIPSSFAPSPAVAQTNAAPMQPQPYRPTQQATPQPQPAQQPKKDAFADLVNLMD